MQLVWGYRLLTYATLVLPILWRNFCYFENVLETWYIDLNLHIAHEISVLLLQSSPSTVGGWWSSEEYMAASIALSYEGGHMLFREWLQPYLPFLLDMFHLASATSQVMALPFCRQVLENHEARELQSQAAEQVLSMLAPPTHSLLQGNGASIREDLHMQTPSAAAATTILELLNKLELSSEHQIVH